MAKAVLATRHSLDLGYKVVITSFSKQITYSTSPSTSRTTLGSTPSQGYEVVITSFSNPDDLFDQPIDLENHLVTDSVPS